MSNIVDDIQKFRELLNKTPEQLNEMFNYDQKKGGQARPPQDKLGMRPTQGIAKHPEDYKDMMTNPKMSHVKSAYAAGGPKSELPEDEDSDFMTDIVDETGMDEEHQIDELTKDTLQRYKAAADKDMRAMGAHITLGDTPINQLNPTKRELGAEFGMFGKTMQNRQRGIKKAERKINTKTARGELEESDSSAVQAITPLYQKVQGLVPSFKEPVRGHLLNAQKSLRAALDAAQGGQVNENDDAMLNENQKVTIIGYNSAYRQLDQAAKDPKNKRTVTVVKLGMDSDGAPELTFTDTDGSNYKAQWNPQYGWVADFN